MLHRRSRTVPRAAVGVGVSAVDHFQAYPDGSAACPAVGGTGTSIKIARVLPLSG